MTEKELEIKAIDYFKKVNPHLKDDKYFLEKLYERSQTYKAFIDGARLSLELLQKEEIEYYIDEVENE